MPPDTSIMWPKMNKEELINYANSHFASSFASLPDVSTMLFMGQKLDPRGGQSKLLIGTIVRDEKRVPLWAYITRPSWVAFSCRAGERLLMSAVATDPSVMLDRPFKFIGTSRRTMGLEALVLYYHVAGNRWDKFETNPNTLINVGVLEKACRMVRNATTSQVGTANEEVPTPAAFVNTLESDVSSGSDSEDDGSLFVKTCKRCRRMDREDSRCRSEGHIKTMNDLQKEIDELKKQAAQDKKDLARARRQRDAVILEAGYLEIGFRETADEKLEEEERSNEIEAAKERVEGILGSVLGGETIPERRMKKLKKEFVEKASEEE